MFPSVMTIAMTSLSGVTRTSPMRMAAADWASSRVDSLPLLHLELEKEGTLLPGEARRLDLDTATALTALDMADDGCVGCLVTTRERSVAATTAILQIRHVYSRPVGAAIDVVAVGRAHIGEIDDGRCFMGRGMTVKRDEEDVDEAGKQLLLGGLRDLKTQESKLLRQLHQDAEHISFDEAAANLRTELCAYNLDLAPDETLERHHGLWGVTTEAAADIQLASFAAFAEATAVQRLIALDQTSTAGRLKFAKTCSWKVMYKLAAALAVRDALTPSSK